MAAKQSQEQKDFNKSKRGLMEVLDSLRWNTIDDGDRGKVKSILKAGPNYVFQ